MSETAGIDVLHVDDQPDFVGLATDMLEREDDRFSVETATSASEGLDRLAADDFDCIVSDYQMPGRNGIEFLETVREEYPDLPFILFTGKGSEDVASDAISAGATEYLQKKRGADQFELLANRIETIVSRQRAESNYREIFEKANDGIAIHDPDTSEILDANSRFCEMRGYTRDELIGQRIEKIIANEPPYTLEEAHRRIQQALDGEPQVFEWVDETKAGDRLPVEVNLKHTSIGGQECVLAQVRDISEHRERERSLKQLQQRTQALMHTATKEETAQIAVETAHGVLGAQLSGCHFVGADQQTLEPIAFVDTVREELGEPPTYDRTANDDPASQVVWQAFESGEPLVIDDIREYGRLAEVTPARSAIIHPLNGQGVFIVSATKPNAFDDTDRAFTEIVATSLKSSLKRVDREQQLRSQNKRLDQFASVVSHDMRNPLSVATGRLELAQDECDSTYLDDVAHAHDRMEKLIDDLLSLARAGERVDETEAVNLADMTDDCWATVTTGDATLVTDTELTIQADRSRLKGLFENLFRNAVEHTGDNVTVTVRDLDDRNGFYVADDGPGIPEDKRDEVFEAGYSTTDGSIGFGLHIVQKIAEAHGWNIAVTDGETDGARFEITDVNVGAE